ncbi:MAG TPA: BON domain-containing protein [Lacunisphaera sp.]|nr:BON domain-containing protein [Lacunisphaera sp.]
MKTSLLLSTSFLALGLGIGIGAAGCHKNTAESAMDKTSDAVGNAYDKTKDAVATAADKTRDAAVDTKNAIADKLRDWKLTPSDLKTDMQKGGRVVRDKTQAAGEKVGGAIDNARIVTVINGKYVADSDLSALKINVDADNGVVTLKGTVKSLDAVGKAMALALDTDGVHQVVSLLTVENP